MDLEILKTVADVFVALGGNPGVAAITDANPSTVSMWKSGGSFPANTYLVLTHALHEQNKTALASLWGMKCPSRPVQHERKLKSVKRRRVAS